MQQNTSDKSTLVKVMAWHHQAPAITWANVDPNLCCHMGPLLLTWFNFNPSMDK